MSHFILECAYCGEIDIVAKKGDMLIFIEVKARKSTEKCYDAITNKQLNRIQRASNIFIKMNQQFLEKSTRFDVILISNWQFPIHIQNVTM